MRPAPRWMAVIIVAAGLAAYSNSLRLPFVFDDQSAIVDNPSLRDWTNLDAVLHPERERPVAGRPLVNASFAINYAIGGLDTRGYHAVNLAIHLAAALLVFGIVRRTVARTDLARLPDTAAHVAFATALIWVVHPLTTEAVDYVTQRTELMMALFYLLTLYAAIRSAASPASPWSAIAIAACAAGMACKESMVTAPVVVVLYDRVFLFDSLRQAVRKRWPLYAGLAAGWIVLGVLLASGPRVHSAGFASGVSAWTYLLNQAAMILRYVKLAVWPQSLVIYYGWPLPLTISDALPALLAVAALLGAAVAAMARAPKAGFAAAFFFIAIAPTSSFVPIATEVGAERRMYLPLIGAIVLAVAAIASFRRIRWRGLAAALLIVAAACGVMTWRRNADYSSPLRLAQTAVERYPTPFGHHLLAIELQRVGRTDEAMAHLRLAVPTAPRAYYTLGVALFKQGERAASIAALQSFLREQPQLQEAVAARQLLGRALALEHHLPQAVAEYETVLKMNPTPTQRVETEGLLGEALLDAGRFEQAADHLLRYVAERRGEADPLIKLGVAMANLGRMPDAAAMFQRAVDADPRNADARRNLANALFELRAADQAIGHAKAAVELRPEDPGAHNVLGRCLAATGRYPEAIAELERAARLAPDDATVSGDLEKLRRLLHH